MVCSAAHAAPPAYYLRDDLAVRRPWAGPPHGVWLGSVAELGLVEGALVDDKVFAQLARGRRVDGRMLESRLYQGGRSRWAIDLSFGAPKSLTLHWLESRDRASVEWAHHEAVVKAMQFLLSAPWIARRGKAGARRECVAPPPMAAFLQLAARPSGGAEPLPHLHSHVAIFNLSMRGDGRWGGVDLHLVFRSQKMLTGIYHDELAAALARRGIAVDRSAEGYVTLPHFERSVVDAFSMRSLAIVEEGARSLRSGGAEVSRIARATRERKPRLLDFDATLRKWETRLVAAKADRPDDMGLPSFRG